VPTIPATPINMRTKLRKAACSRNGYVARRQSLSRFARIGANGAKWSLTPFARNGV
jgi:hypothetical protein